MIEKLKRPLICAIAALILSFLLGLISGVRFSSIIIRSLVISVISGCFVFGVRILLEQFVPDLFQPIAGKETEKREVGKNLNISIDEPINVYEADEEKHETENFNEVEDFSESDIDAKNIYPSGSSPYTALEASEDLKSNASDLVENTFREKSDFNDINEPEGSSLTQEDSSAEKAKEKKQPLQELEELPDLQDFITEDELQQGDEEIDFTERGTGGAFDVSTDLAGSGMDTKNMVQAIRTVLKRES